MVSERTVRADLAAAGSALPGAPDGLAVAALARGRRALRRRRARRAAVSGAALVALGAAYAAVVPAAGPGEAAVACYADRVETRGRATIGDGGVRLVVTNATAAYVRVVAGDAAAVVPPGRSSVEVPVRPGTVPVSCDTGVAVVPAALHVADPEGRYVDDRLSCAGGAVRDLRGDGAVEAGDPVALTRARLGRLRPGAVVEPAGLPVPAGRRVVRVRDGGAVVAVAVWHAMPEPASWVLDEVHLCAPLVLR